MRDAKVVACALALAFFLTTCGGRSGGTLVGIPNPNTNAFASNAFGHTPRAIDFVERLYAAGARHVSVSGILDEPWRIEEEGGPYADTLLVSMPRDPKKKRAVMKVIESASPDEVGPPRGKKATGKLRLWWD